MELSSPLFLHGWAFSSSVFGSLQGIKPDLPAHGRGGDNYRGLDKLVEDIAVSLPSCHDVVGWSLGGSLALLLALKFPSKVRRLFLIGTSPFFGGAWDRTNLRAFKLMIKRKGVEEFRKRAFPKPFRSRFSSQVGMRMLEDYISLDLRKKLPFLRKKVFIIHGEKDPITPVKEALTLHNLIKGSKLIVLPGGHFPFEDERCLLSEVLKVSGDL